MFSVWLFLVSLKYDVSRNIHYARRYLAGYLLRTGLFSGRIGIATLSFLGSGYIRCLSRNRQRQMLATHNYRRVTGQSARLNRSALWVEKALRDSLFYHGDKKTIAQLQQCAEALNSAINQLDDSPRPVILAPFHMVSDVLAGIVCGLLPGSGVSIISTHLDGAVGPHESEALQRNKVKMSLVDPGGISSAELKKLIRDIRAQRCRLVIYPDAPPEVTWHLTRKHMRSEDCHLFNRPARIHSGLSELAKLSDAQVLFFGLVRHQGRLKLRVYGVAQPDEVAVQLPRVLETALLNDPQDWLLWHTPSFYYFHPS